MHIPFYIAKRLDKLGYKNAVLGGEYDKSYFTAKIQGCEYMMIIDSPNPNMETSSFTPAPNYKQVLDWLLASHHINVWSLQWPEVGVPEKWTWCVGTKAEHKDSVWRFISSDFSLGLETAIDKALSLLETLEADDV